MATVQPISPGSYDLPKFEMRYENGRSVEMTGFEICHFQKLVKSGYGEDSRFTMSEPVGNAQWTVWPVKLEDSEYLNIAISHSSPDAHYTANVELLIINAAAPVEKSIRSGQRIEDLPPEKLTVVGLNLLSKIHSEDFLMSNGSLVIYVAVEVLLIVDANQERLMNFYDEAMFPEKSVFTFKFSDGRKLFVDKRVLCRHSSVLAEHIQKQRRKSLLVPNRPNQLQMLADVEDAKNPQLEPHFQLLQFLHGARMGLVHIDEMSVASVMTLAIRYEMKAIFRHFQQLILHNVASSAYWYFLWDLDLPRLVKECLKNAEDAEEMKESINEEHLDMMKTDTLRMMCRMVYELHTK